MQREGRSEDALGHQLVDPKQTFLLMAVRGLGQDLEQLGERGRALVICHVMAGREPTDSPPQPLVTNEGNTLCSQIFLLLWLIQPRPEVGCHSSLYNHKTWARFVGAPESGLDLTPGSGCAEPALDPALGRASLQVDSCVRSGLCPIGGQQGMGLSRTVQSLFLSQTLEWPGSDPPSQAQYSDPRLSSSLTSRTHTHWVSSRGCLSHKSKTRSPF